MRVWSAVSQKGGPGKSTLIGHLAPYAVQCGERVLVVDIDPQESITNWHARRQGDKETPAVLPALADNLPKILDAAQTLGITLTLIDTAGKTDAGAVAAVRAADLIITPSEPTFFALDGLRGTVELLNRLGKLEQAICVINKVMPGKGQKQAFLDGEMQAAALGIMVSPAYLVLRSAYQVSIANGKGITEPKAGVKDAKAVKEIEALWDDLNKRNPLKTDKKEGVTA